MQWVAALLSELGIEAPGAGQPTPKSFPDGAAFRIEIPSVEGPHVLTVNVPLDVTLGELAEMRAAVSVPIDLYVESPDGLGGIVRGTRSGT
jgi:hypothetical protein